MFIEMFAKTRDLSNLSPPGAGPLLGLGGAGLLRLVEELLVLRELELRLLALLLVLRELHRVLFFSSFSLERCKGFGGGEPRIDCIQPTGTRRFSRIGRSCIIIIWMLRV